MGRDKGLLELAGKPLVARAHALIAACVDEVLVSVRADQASMSAYRDFSLVLDGTVPAGPAAGLMAAWRERPGAALLVLAVDMPRVDAATLERLVAARDPETLATAFLHSDGTPEPLCTIWEPAACGVIVEAAGQGGVSLRRVLEAGPATLIEPPEAARLESANEPDAHRRMARELDSL